MISAPRSMIAVAPTPARTALLARCRHVVTMLGLSYLVGERDRGVLPRADAESIALLLVGGTHLQPAGSARPPARQRSSCGCCSFLACGELHEITVEVDNECDVRAGRVDKPRMHAATGVSCGTTCAGSRVI